MADWHLVCAPPSPGAIRTREDLDKTGFEKYASGRRLSDLGVVFALLTTEAHWRAEHLAFDFDKRGRIRRTPEVNCSVPFNLQTSTGVRIALSIIETSGRQSGVC